MTKEQLRAAIGNDDLDQVIRGLLMLADRHSSAELRSDALIQSGRLEEYKKHLRIGDQGAETLSQSRAGVRKALLDLVENLPEKPLQPNPKAPLPGVSEKKFKSALFWVILLGNALILLWVFFQFQTGGFTQKECAATITLLVGIFGAYLVPMYDEFIEKRHIDPFLPREGDKRVTGMLPMLVFGLILPVYIGLMFYFIHLRGAGALGFDDFTTGFTLLSSGLGVYIVRLVNKLFKTD